MKFFKEKLNDAGITNSKKNITQEDLTEILYETDLEKLWSFLKSIFFDNLWKLPKIKVTESEIDIDLYWFVINWSLADVFFNLLKEENFTIKDTYGIEIWNDNFSIYVLSFKYANDIKIKLYKSLSKDILQQIKKIFIDYIIPLIQVDDESEITFSYIKSVFSLADKDKIFYDWKNIAIEVEVQEWTIDNAYLLHLINKVSELNSSILFRLDGWFLQSYKLKVLDEDNNIWAQIKIFKEWKSLNINITPSYWKKINKSFLQNFVANLIFGIKSYFSQKEVNYLDKLEKLWVKVKLWEFKNESIDNLFLKKWFVGYEDIKEEIKTHIIEPWKNKEEFEKKSKELFPNLKNLLPNAVLFYWEPWTWKTTVASVIWEYLHYPFVYVPINSILSKWYWESENKLNDIFETCWNLAKKYNWVVIMIDEIDEIWISREKSYEWTWRITWVLLKKLDGLEKIENILLIWATNRETVLDSALLSRFSKKIKFRLPNKEEIKNIVLYYLPILRNKNIDQIVEQLDGKSWRYIKKVSEDFARYVIKNNIQQDYEKEFIKFLKTDD